MGTPPTGEKRGAAWWVALAVLLGRSPKAILEDSISLTEKEKSNPLPAIVPAGSAVFFSPHTVHGSEPNLSDEPRRALVLTYQPAGKRMFKLDRVRECGARPRS